MRTAHAKGKSVNVMGNVTNAENIMPSLNVRCLLLVKEKNGQGRIVPVSIAVSMRYQSEMADAKL